MPSDMTDEEKAAEKAEKETQVTALFRNIDLPPVEVYWQTQVRFMW